MVASVATLEAAGASLILDGKVVVTLSDDENNTFDIVLLGGCTKGVD